MNHPRTAEPAVTTIARLNDEFRSTFEGGEVLMTAAVNALPLDVRAAAIVALQASTVFTKDSDPYQERDFGTSRSLARRSSGRSTTTTRSTRMVPRILAISTKRHAH